MSCINRVMLSGNLTREPELKMTQGGTAVLTFGIAVNGKKGGQDYTNFFDCVVFGNYAAAMQQHLAKGQKVAIDGHLSYRTWEHDGQRRSAVEVIVRSIDTIGRAPARSAEDYAQGQQIPLAAAPPQVPVGEVYDEDIPFD